MDTKQLIELLGGRSEVARMCECTPQAVSQWIENGVPNARLLFFKAIRPDLPWSEFKDQESTQQQ